MYCGKCGTELIDGICPKCTQNNMSVSKDFDEKFKKFFMSPNEKLITVLGNSYVENFFNNGSIKKGFAVVSNKRVYFQGKKYDTYDDGTITKTYNSRTVDLTDVTGTGFDQYSDTSWLINAVVTLVLSFIAISLLSLLFTDGEFSPKVLMASLVLPIYCMYQYFKSRVSLITIQYAGGEIGFDIRWFPQQEMELFQKQLRMAKDKVIEENETLSAKRLQEALLNTEKPIGSVADEISKLADLLSKGAITQEEFNKMKSELIK